MMIRERDGGGAADHQADTPEAIEAALARARAYLSASAEDRLEETAHDPEALARALRTLGREPEDGGDEPGGAEPRSAPGPAPGTGR